MKSLDDLDVAGRTVLVRADFNVPLADGPGGTRVITDDGRIVAEKQATETSPTEIGLYMAGKAS